MKTVRDVMTTSVLSVRPDALIKDVARLLIENRISGLPVVDDTGRVIGVISEGDLLVKEQSRSAIHRRPLARIFGESGDTRQSLAKVDARTAGDAMTTPPVTIDASSPVGMAATLMIQRRVNRLPVLENDRLAGIATRADVISAFVRTDEDLADAIRHEVLHRMLWLDPSDFSVAVADGVATISGRVGRRSTVGIIERSVEMLPGIVAVLADITWTIDDRDIDAPGPDYLSPKSPS